MAKGSDTPLSKEEILADLNGFCLGLWESYLTRFMPEDMEGSEDYTPLEFSLKPYVMEGGGTILFAPPGRGKSYTALLWAVSIDAGLDKFWHTEQGKVLYINLERSKETLKRRLSRVNRILGVEPTRPLLTLNARGQSLMGIISTCQRSIKENNVKLVILDSVSRAGFGDLNENRPVNTIIDALSSLSATWLALGHTPRQNEDHVYGSIFFEAGADIVVQLISQKKDDGTLGIGYKSTKQNDMPAIPLTIYAMEFDDIGLVNFRPAKSYEFPEVEKGKSLSAEQLIDEFLLEQETADATATQVAEHLEMNRSNISHLMKHSDRYVETRKEGKAVYYGVKTLP